MNGLKMVSAYQSSGESAQECRVTIRIGIMGDFNQEFPSHTTIAPSLQHAGRALGIFRPFRGLTCLP